mmetsp:Transcript_1621/g.3431  ORF Transcript_1621/g.3431 Transcript_1621/m.3431 type:complete len:114 (+) Transcript_1621:254-595(+)
MRTKNCPQHLVLEAFNVHLEETWCLNGHTNTLQQRWPILEDPMGSGICITTSSDTNAMKTCSAPDSLRNHDPGVHCAVKSVNVTGSLRKNGYLEVPYSLATDRYDAAWGLELR